MIQVERGHLPRGTCRACVPHLARITNPQRLQRPVTDPNLELGGEGIGKWGDTVNAWNRV